MVDQSHEVKLQELYHHKALCPEAKHSHDYSEMQSHECMAKLQAENLQIEKSRWPSIYNFCGL